MSVAAAELSPSMPREGKGHLAANDELIELLTESLLHDVRNPLNVLSIHLEVLSERLRHESGGTLLPGYQKSLTAMRDQIGRVDQVLARFGEFAAPQDEAAGPIDLSALVQRALEALGHHARRHRVQLRGELEPGVEAQVADPRQLRREILALMVRAIAASGEGGGVAAAVISQRQQAVLRVEVEGRSKEAFELYLPLE